jgi:hypothetical protein
MTTRSSVVLLLLVLCALRVLPQDAPEFVDCGSDEMADVYRKGRHEAQAYGEAAWNHKCDKAKMVEEQLLGSVPPSVSQPLLSTASMQPGRPA